MKLIFIILLILLFFSSLFRLIIKKLPHVVFYSFIDLYEYFIHKKYNNCPFFGKIEIYCATPSKRFGCGKTLTVVDKAISIYKKYNGLPIFGGYDENFKPYFITQKITIISNTELFGVPFIPFEGVNQLYDYKCQEGEVLICVIDEIGTIFNNRDFKSFPIEVFNAMVQSRKRKIFILGTLPVFEGTDVQIRRFCDSVFLCRKTWRFVKLVEFCAQDLELCGGHFEVLQPLSVRWWFVHNRHYNQYDTNLFISQLEKQWESGNLLTFNELENTSALGTDFVNLKKRWRNRKK